MALRIAPCPKCQRPLVFGERNCRTCGQAFNYGTRDPPEPSFAEVVEALRAGGHAPPTLDDAVAVAPPVNAPYRTAAPAPAPHPRSIPSGAPVSDVPTMAGLDTGRFEPVGDVRVDDIPGFVDSSLYRAFTPAHVDVQQVADLDTGRAADVGAVRVQLVPGVEPTAKEAVGAVATEDIPGIFHSDFLRAPEVPIIVAAIDGLERSPRASHRTSTAAPAGKRQGKSAGAFEPCTCNCGTTHRLPRCPSCGTPHRDADD